MTRRFLALLASVLVVTAIGLGIVEDWDELPRHGTSAELRQRADGSDLSPNERGPDAGVPATRAVARKPSEGRHDQSGSDERSGPIQEEVAGGVRDPSIEALERIYGEGADRLVGANLPPAELAERFFERPDVNPRRIELSDFHLREIRRLTSPFSQRLRELRGEYAEAQFEAVTKLLSEGRFVETTDAGVSEGLSSSPENGAFAMISGAPGEPYRAMVLSFTEFPRLPVLRADAIQQDQFRRQIAADYISGLR